MELVQAYAAVYCAFVLVLRQVQKWKIKDKKRNFYYSIEGNPILRWVNFPIPVNTHTA